VKKDRIYKKGHKIRICWRGEDKTTKQWLSDPRCPLSDRQLRRRTGEHLYGKLHLTVEEIITKPCIKQGELKPRDRAREKARTDVRLSKEEKWERLRNRVATGTAMSPRLSESVRYRKMAAMVRGE